MANSKHPWYDTWKYHKRREYFPWKTDFSAFRSWAEKVDYDPKRGDKICQEYTDGTYRIYVQREDGFKGLYSYVINKEHQGLCIDRRRLVEALRRAHKNIIFQKPLERDPKTYRIVMSDDVWVNLLRELGLSDSEIEKKFLQPLEYEDSEAGSEDFSTERIRDVFTRMHESCYNTGSAAYELVGARGVCVSGVWHDFENFRSWAESEFERTSKDPCRPFTLIRVNRHKGFYPTNCKIA